MTNLKQQLRELVTAKLKALTEAERRVKNQRITAALLACPEFQRARTILAYDSCKLEASTQEIMAACLSAGKTLALPRTQKKDCSLAIQRVIDFARDLAPCRLGFREPKAELPAVPLEQIELVIVPGVAFDPHGNRLGRGKGYYDRFLSQLGPGRQWLTCAPAFECQLVVQIPTTAHDRPVQMLITEDRVIRIESSPINPQF